MRSRHASPGITKHVAIFTKIPFTRDELIEASEGADALLITPLERLDSEFFKRVPASVR